ncbi:heavy-metal-associated domain-containing protein [Ornithinibacillus bavariensis]|uniref:Copper chaperone CopZ n=1 Tax=Ornithinibacillus bavariensis TaxID=545502 RepID=A0A919X6P3_9BACI|nr:heavy metal-associated domain-containing protein [Ornithinibacillus bavariensis]GIO25868.1 mercuric transport protein periplasmic component MerP [Ornithinibacillus bavariensis]
MEQTISLEIKGMHCPNCPAKIERSLTKLDGVSKVEVYYEEENGFVTFDPSKVDVVHIINRISKLGFDATTKVTNQA